MTTDAENSAYERAWQIELKVEELFRRDDPTGSFVRRLPQFRSSCPDPMGDGILRVPPGAQLAIWDRYVRSWILAALAVVVVEGMGNPGGSAARDASSRRRGRRAPGRGSSPDVGRWERVPLAPGQRRGSWLNP
jgi:hypothetical protein